MLPVVQSRWGLWCCSQGYPRITGICGDLLPDRSMWTRRSREDGRPRLWLQSDRREESNLSLALRQVPHPWCWHQSQSLWRWRGSGNPLEERLDVEKGPLVWWGLCGGMAHQYHLPDGERQIGWPGHSTCRESPVANAPAPSEWGWCDIKWISVTYTQKHRDTAYVYKVYIFQHFNFSTIIFLFILSAANST